MTPADTTTVATERSEVLRALMERADRARAQAQANGAALERAMARTRAFDLNADVGLRPGRRLVDDAAIDARIRDLEATVEGLTKRLESQGPIEQAKGIIMAQTRCDPDQAFEILRRASQRSNTKLRLLAQDLVTRTTKVAAEHAVDAGR